MSDGALRFDPPVLPTQAHASSAFGSGEPVLDDWLRQRAWSNLQNAASRTYVVCPAGADTVAGYVSLGMSAQAGRSACAA